MNNIQPEQYMGEIVEVQFYDHFWGGKDELGIHKIWGRLIEVTWQKLVLRVWEADDNEDEHQEFASIVRSTIVSIRPMGYTDECD